MTPFTAFYAPLRSLLGDRQTEGAWTYEDGTLASALSGTFAMGRSPAGFALATDEGAAVSSANIGDATQVKPDVDLGGNFARICYEAARLLVLGEDGAVRVQTRAFSVSDQGDRRRDLLAQLELWIREGQIDELFDVSQRFVQWASAGVKLTDYPGIRLPSAAALPEIVF